VELGRLRGVARTRVRPGPLVGIALAYLVAVTGLMIWRGISVSPDYLLLLMVPIALASGRLVGFLRDWVPFIALFLAYEAMRGLAAKTGFAPHVGDLASAEQWLFGGHVPSAVLQSTVHGSAVGGAADYFATVVYFCHFAVPLTVGMVIWLVDRTQFLRYTTALLGMSCVAFVVFLLVPTAPPWYAAQAGVIHDVHKIITDTLPSAVSPYYVSLNPNPVAAMPSLHMAFPVLSLFALVGVWPRRGWAFALWCVAVFFSIVYLGEHYAVDALAGIVLASLSWAVMMRVVVPRIGAFQRAQQRGSSGAPAPARVATEGGVVA
jgi:membrane-associated phospholipid phosphatase